MSKLQKNKLAFGADPEFFAGCYGKDNQLAVVPPVVFRTDLGYTAEIEPGDPEGKHPVFKRYGDTKVHEDGAAFEMSTPPSNNWKELWDTIHHVKAKFSQDVLAKFDVCNPVLYSLPTMNWQVERWINRKSDFRMATRFGCDPDMDAVDTEYICHDIDAASHPERYAGGHIHISGIPEIAERPLDAIKSMMMTAGLAAVGYSDVPDLERRRTFLYGRPSKFRPQKYPDGTVGVEYRTPSTRWTSSFELAEKVFTWATIGLESLLQRNLIAELEDFLLPDVCRAIVEVDQNKAKDILKFISSKV